MKKKCGIVTMVSTILVGLAFGLASCNASPECSCGCGIGCCDFCRKGLTVCKCNCEEPECSNTVNDSSTDSDSEEKVED